MTVNFNTTNLYLTNSVNSINNSATGNVHNSSVFTEDKKNIATLETQTKKFYNISDEKWEMMSESEKQEKCKNALIAIIDRNNEVYKDQSDKQMTYVEQYKLYAARCSTKEEVIRLTKTVKAMDKDNQLQAFIASFQYQQPEFRNIAERILAGEYVELHDEVIPDATKIIAENFSEENQVIAAQNANKAKVELQEAVVTNLMTAENEKVDNALAQKVGEFGVDKDGNLVDDIQLNLFKQINKSKYESTLKLAAQNIFRLNENNIDKAVEITKSTGNKDAINSITITKPETEKSAQQSSSNDNVNDEIKNIKEAIENGDKNSIKTCLETMSTTDLQAFITENKDTNLINQILENDPPVAVLNILNNVLKNTNSVNYKSGAKEIGFLDLTVQTEMVKQAAANNDLDSIKRTYLNAYAKNEYDKYQAKLQFMA